MADIQLFNNGEFELSFTPRGESFIVSATVVARALAFHSARDLVRTIPDKEKGWELSPTLGGDQRAWYLTEAGFYRALGQRQAARVRDAVMQKMVVRFQDWVYGEVLPSLRKKNDQQPMQRVVEGNIYEPHTLTWEEAAALIRQRYGIRLRVNELTRMLRTAGVLKQTGAPRKDYESWFWFTQSAWTIHPHVIPQLAQKAYDIGRELQDFRFLQARLELEGVGQSFDAAPTRRLAA